MVDFDAFQLRHPFTGLGKVTRELLVQWADDGRGGEVRVFCPASVDPRELGLDPDAFNWVAVALSDCRPDYRQRFHWAQSVSRLRRVPARDSILFIPYLYNYGKLSDNVILIPDLLYRIVPFAGYHQVPWWQLRRKFYLRRMVMRVEEQLVKRARRWIVYSNFVLQHVQKVLRLPRARVHLVPLGTPRSFVAQGDPASDRRIRERLNLPERFVLYSGGFGNRKNVPMLAEVCRRVQSQLPDFACVTVGGQCNSPGLVNCPNVTEIELAALHRMSRFSVYPSRCEGFGLPPVEAAACGRFCLVADNSSLPEVQPLEELRLPTDGLEDWVQKISLLWANQPAYDDVLSRSLAASQVHPWKVFSDGVWNLLTVPGPNDC